MTPRDYREWLQANSHRKVQAIEVITVAKACIDWCEREIARLFQELQACRPTHERASLPFTDGQLLKRIETLVCRDMNVRPSDLRGNSRTRRVTEARDVYAVLLRDLLGMTITDIGRDIGRHHSTVLSMQNNVDLEPPGGRRKPRVNRLKALLAEGRV